MCFISQRVTQFHFIHQWEEQTTSAAKRTGREVQQLVFKAAKINIFILTVDQMTVMKCVNRTDDHNISVWTLREAFLNIWTRCCILCEVCQLDCREATALWSSSFLLNYVSSFFHCRGVKKQKNCKNVSVIYFSSKRGHLHWCLQLWLINFLWYLILR